MYKKYDTALVNDAMEQKGTMDVGIKPVSPGMEIIGKAYTVDCYPGSIITCHKALLEVPKDSVLVINGRDNSNGALWGGLMTNQAIKKGIKGVVVDGAVRDVAYIKNTGFPVFSRYITPSVGSNRKVGSTGNDIVCGGVTVKTGDLIIGDDDGVVVVPQNRIKEILSKAEEISLREKELSKKIEAGLLLADEIGMTPIIDKAKESEN